MSEPNPWLEKSAAERARQRALLDQADAADDARGDVAAAAMMRLAYNRLKERGKLGAAWEGFNHQALPKEANLAKPAGLSETEVSNIEKAIGEALAKASKG